MIKVVVALLSVMVLHTPVQADMHRETLIGMYVVRQEQLEGSACFKAAMEFALLSPAEQKAKLLEIADLMLTQMDTELAANDATTVKLQERRSELVALRAAVEAE